MEVLLLKRDVLKLPTDHEKDWATTMTTRLHNALSHAAKGVRGNRKWAIEVLGLPAVAKPEVGVVWVYGWCSENSLAYRCRNGGARELSNPIVTT